MRPAARRTSCFNVWDAAWNFRRWTPPGGGGIVGPDKPEARLSRPPWGSQMLDRRMLVRAAMAAPLACPLPVWARAATPPADSAAMARFIAGLPTREFPAPLEVPLEAETNFESANRHGLSLPY